jgi:hypothetical protein
VNLESAESQSSLYEERSWEADEDEALLSYNYGERSVELWYSKKHGELRIDGALPAVFCHPAESSAAIDYESIDVDQVSEVLFQELGLYADIEAVVWMGTARPHISLSVHPMAGVVVQDIAGRVVRRIDDPFAADDVPE